MGPIRIVATATSRLTVGARTDVTSCDEPERGDGNEKSCSKMHGCGLQVSVKRHRGCDVRNTEKMKGVLDSKL